MSDEKSFDRMAKMSAYQSRKLNNGTLWLLFLFLGWSYGSMGEMVKQIFYYLTLCGFGLWFLYRLFTLNGKIKKYNSVIANQIGLSPSDRQMLGLY